MHVSHITLHPLSHLISHSLRIEVSLKKMKPRMELEELYQGVPDESVNLTFQDLAHLSVSEKKNNIQEEEEKDDKVLLSQQQQHNNDVVLLSTRSPALAPLLKIPSLDFKTALHTPPEDLSVTADDKMWGYCGNNYGHHHHHKSSGGGGGGRRSPMRKATTGCDDVASGASTVVSGKGGGRRRRPGIPHSKICTICSTYVYMFRTRCLVCGRVYCRQCLEMGMGEMIEGRKCIECLGLKFSQRYIERAGKLGCWSWRYPSTLKQTEMKWAEKGAKRSGSGGGYNSHYSGMASSRSRSISPIISPRNMTSPHHLHDNNEPSFVISSSFSPFSTPQHHHFPL